MTGISDALRQMRLPAGFNEDLLTAAADAIDNAEAGRAKDHQNTMHMIRALGETFRDEKSAWQAEREKMDKDLGEVIDVRDEYHDMADRLAQSIADYFLAPIGEHSSANCPWMRALEVIEGAAPAVHGDAPAYSDLISLLPPAGYLYPTDAKHVPLLVQLQRMAKDAARYRRVRENWIDCDEIGLHGRTVVVDSAVDAATQSNTGSAP